jgi:peptide/nickel transport system substrate-binding protein
MRATALATFAFFAALPVLAQVTPTGADRPVHGIAMYGEPALPPDFVSLPHANPEAPRGGRLTLPEVGSFDSLNPFVQRGTAPWGVGLLTTESLLGRSHDEPFTLYGLLAESVQTDSQRAYVEFTLREGARFSDGSPVTIDDVLWSYEALGTRGHARFRTAWTRVAAMRQTGPRSLRFDFTEPDRELPLILGLRPILQRAQFDEGAGGLRFEDGGMTPVIGSGPYVVAAAEPGRQVTFRANPDWWGRDLPLNAGQHNFDEIRWEYFGDVAVAFEAFKAGLVSVWRESSAARWLDSFDFPAVRDGRVRLLEIPHGRPSGMNGFVLNTRRAPLDDWRVREALILAFDFDQVNRMIGGGVEPRIPSYFGNSDLAMTPGAPAEGIERDLLAPFADSLPPGALDGYALPVSDGSGNRRNIRAALRLLAEAGYEPDAQGRQRNADGQLLELTLLLRQGQADLQAVATAYTGMLDQLGITLRTTVIDPAQFVERTNAYDFDLTHMLRLMSLSPGYEQVLYWGAAGVEAPGTRNLAGVNSPAVEAMIATLLTTEDRETFVAATRALDRALMAGRYVVPLWYSPASRLAVDARLRHPDRLPLYGDWTGFLPEVWWMEP